MFYVFINQVLSFSPEPVVILSLVYCVGPRAIPSIYAQEQLETSDRLAYKTVDGLIRSGLLWPNTCYFNVFKSKTHQTIYLSLPPLMADSYDLPEFAVSLLR